MKILLWSCVSLGLLPCMFLAWQGYVYFRFLAFQRQFASMHGGFIHDSYFRIKLGNWEAELYPRLWAFTLLTAGIIAIILSLIVLLHVPSNSENDHTESVRISPASGSGLGNS